MKPLPHIHGFSLYKETWTEGKKITDLEEGDLIYVKKIINGFPHIYECEFLKLEKGLVYVKILLYSPEWWKPQNEFIRVRQKSCYLWGKDNELGWARCHWLKDGIFR